MNNDLVTVELDKVRTLKFTRKALKSLENVLGAKMSKIDFEQLGVDEMTKMVHLGLLHEDEALTLEKTEQLIDECPYFGVIAGKAIEAFALAINGPVKGKPEKK
jgi:hypothetical protein